MLTLPISIKHRLSVNAHDITDSLYRFRIADIISRKGFFVKIFLKNEKIYEFCTVFFSEKTKSEHFDKIILPQ